MAKADDMTIFPVAGRLIVLASHCVSFIVSNALPHVDPESVDIEPYLEVPFALLIERKSVFGESQGKVVI
jgi:hypothetical protein